MKSIDHPHFGHLEVPSATTSDEPLAVKVARDGAAGVPIEDVMRETLARSE
ncbi:hypothetical protein ACFVH0_08845 [Streptomyces sp. NPDC127117]|uniref:hypothetical protein n=1 Tax=Streptomyces sp. NPDC127117 TaxID=3345368 RepID=UPI003635AA21